MMNYFKEEIEKMEKEINKVIKKVATNFTLSNQNEITIIELTLLLKEVENKLDKELKEFFLKEYEVVYENDFEYCYVGYNVKSFMENKKFQNELENYLDIFYGIIENKIKIEESTIFIYPVENNN